MGRKRGRHIVRIGEAIPLLGVFSVYYTTSKCKYARPLRTYVNAQDELEAYQSFNRTEPWPGASRRKSKGANQ